MAVGDTTISVSAERVSRQFSEEKQPTNAEDAIEAARARMADMNRQASEGPDWAAQVAAQQEAVGAFSASAPAGLNFADGTNCTGVGVSANGGGQTYVVERTVGPSPSRLQPDVFYRNSSGERVVVGTITSPGRMNGAFGWGSRRNLIAGALASFTHNFVSSLLAYFDRPGLPYTGEGWQLPNLVLAETREPEQFHPAASFAFSLRPSVVKRFTITVESSTAGTLGLDLWDNNKENVARRDDISIKSGTNQIELITYGPSMNNGYLNVEPLDAPQGVTVTEVATFPNV